MNEVEAIKIMKYNKHLLGLPDQGEAWRENSNTIACDLAISALEKQIPKKPEWTPAYQSYFSAGDEAEPLCPGCGELIEEDEPICLDCYQVIDWSVEE